jgi:hypothetical protein
MIDDEFEVCFELLLSVMLTNTACRGCRCGFPASPISRGHKKKNNNRDGEKEKMIIHFDY